MKVLHIESGRHLYGGAQQVLFLLRNLPKEGVESVLLCEQQSAIAQACEREGIATLRAAMAGDLDLRTPVHIRRACQKVQPDLIHVHSRRGVDIWTGWVARQLGIPAVISRRVDNPEPSWLAQRKYGMYARVITISEGIRQVLLKQGVPESKLSLVRSAMEFESYPEAIPVEVFRQRFGIRPGARVVACAAQLIDRKGHRYLLEALPAVKAQVPQLQVLLFGKGRELNALREQVRQLGLEDVVQFPGFVDDIKRLYPHVEVLVHPALMEGLGVALIEASYARVPVIATRVGGIPEIVRDRENGILIPPADSTAIQNAMLELLARADLRKTLGEGGRKLAQREFAVDPMAAGNAQVYRSVLS